MQNNKKILLVEDDNNFGLILRDYLIMSSFDVTLARNGLEGIEKFKKNTFDLCILDVMMPYKDGFTLAAEIRAADKEIPLIFLTAKSMKEDVLKGFQLGADDYLTKPFDTEVLMLKIRSMLRRRELTPPANSHQFLFEIGQFTLNTKLRHLKYKDESPIKLSPKENELLKLLLLYLNDLMPRELALNKIWKEDTYFTSRSMDVYIAKIRKHFKKDPNVEIVNVHGEGFRLTVQKNVS